MTIKLKLAIGYKPQGQLNKYLEMIKVFDSSLVPSEDMRINCNDFFDDDGINRSANVVSVDIDIDEDAYLVNLVPIVYNCNESDFNEIVARYKGNGWNERT